MRLRIPWLATLAGHKRRLVDAWLDRRVPVEGPRIRIERRRLFILPTRLGYTFALMVIALLLGSLNYNTSLGFAVTFLLAGAGAMGMLQTYGNLDRLVLRFAPAGPVFAGSRACFPVRLEAPKPARWGIRLHDSAASPLAVRPDEETPSQIVVPANRRGRMRMPRIRVMTEWPLGLFHVWSWVQPSVDAIVYPRPVDHGREPPLERPASDQGPVRRTDDEDFAGLREYQPGDPARRIAWKALAHRDDLQTKVFEAARAGDRWFTWWALDDLDAEARLEQLCHWVVAAAAGERYGLDLPGRCIEPDAGVRHRARCLEALALFGLEDDT